MSGNHQERYVVLDVETTGLWPWTMPAWWPGYGWRWRGDDMESVWYHQKQNEENGKEYLKIEEPIRV